MERFEDEVIERERGGEDSMHACILLKSAYQNTQCAAATVVERVERGKKHATCYTLAFCAPNTSFIF